MITTDGSRAEPPFSSGTDRDTWIDRNCATCIHDKAQRTNPPGPGCPLLLLVLVEQRTPAQWFEDTNGDHRCIEYRHEDDGPAEPQPIPDPPGQLVLMPRERFEGVRMLTPLESGTSGDHSHQPLPQRHTALSSGGAW